MGNLDLSVARSIRATLTMIRSCENCKKEFRRIKSQIRSEKVFCSQSCANSFNNKRVIRNFKDGSGSYRTRAIRELTFVRCSNKNCPVEKAKIPIPDYMFDVDHIAGKKAGHALDNLQLLCVWCHAEKTRKV